MGEKMIEESNDVLNNYVLNILEGKVNKFGYDFVFEDLNKLWIFFVSFCGFEVVFDEIGEFFEVSCVMFFGF